MLSQRLLRRANKNASRAMASAMSSLRIVNHGGFSEMTTSSPSTTSTFRSLSTSSSIPSWATADPKAMGVDPEPYAVKNLVDGEWQSASSGSIVIPHPLDASAPPIFTIPDTQTLELDPFYESLRKVSKSGLHNPLKNPERYVQYGEISRKVRTPKSNSSKAHRFNL